MNDIIEDFESGIWELMGDLLKENEDMMIPLCRIMDERLKLYNDISKDKF